MPQDQVDLPATAGSTATARRPLPDGVVQVLRQAFAAELAERLPRLRAQPAGPDALRDAHTIGSSAVVVGAPDASRCARALEAELARPCPDDALAAALVAELDRLLAPWR